MSSYKNGNDPGFWELATFDRLAEQYGGARAKRIMLGEDTKTNADIEAWRRLGQRKDAA
ncbi:hypothetical protein [Phenylobacterium sp.]|uniref:hypothetical protein n=1 Tax=Phenylobacterium sp. TaxID=1871053 RepID=UPI002FC90741